MVAKWLALLHKGSWFESGLGGFLCGVCMFYTLSAWLLSAYSGFKDMYANLVIGAQSQPGSVSMLKCPRTRY